MNKYKAAYKCPLCGSLIKNSEAVEVPCDRIPEILADIVKNQQFLSSPYLYQAPMHLSHKCINGNIGLATFAGFVKE